MLTGTWPIQKPSSIVAEYVLSLQNLTLTERRIRNQVEATISLELFTFWVTIAVNAFFFLQLYLGNNLCTESLA